MYIRVCIYTLLTAFVRRRIFNDEYWSSVCKRKLIWWWCQLTRRQGQAGGQTWPVKAEMLSERGDRCIHCEEFNLPMEKLWLFTSQSHGTYMYRAAARNRKTYSQVGKTDTQSQTLMAQREYAGQKKCLFSCVRNYIMWWRVAQVRICVTRSLTPIKWWSDASSCAGMPAVGAYQGHGAIAVQASNMHALAEQGL